MISVGLTWTVATFIAFITFSSLVRVEQKRGKRFVLAGIRNGFDQIVAKIGGCIVRTWNHFVKYIVQLGWYYGLHSFLRALLHTLVKLYEKIEFAFESNRKRTKELRAEKKKQSNDTPSHLTEMAEHKAATALSQAEKAKLKRTQLEGE